MGYLFIFREDNGSTSKSHAYIAASGSVDKKLEHEWQHRLRGEANNLSGSLHGSGQEISRATYPPVTSPNGIISNYP